MKWFYIIFALQTIGCTLLAVYCLYKWSDLFKKIKRNNIRHYLKVLTLTIIFYTAFMPANLGWPAMENIYRSPLFIIGAYFYVGLVSIITVSVYNVMAVKFKKKPVAYQNIVSFCTIAFLPFILDIFGQILVGYKGKELITNISYSLFIGCMAALLHLFFANYSKKTELALSQAEYLKIQAELNALQAKVDPHFLYNALSGLAGLALENGKNASKMATALSHWFRYSINREGKFKTTVDEEMDMLNNYIAIEKIRFENAIAFNIHVDEASKTKTIPLFLIQPLVENAIKHAFEKMTGTGIIDVNITYNKYLHITVSDNGQPFVDNLKMGYGLSSIYQKLNLLFKDKYEVSINNGPSKNITIKIYN
jgi:two-component system, LytTR family, sensor kinase